jgi:hypothetical protein
MAGSIPQTVSAARQQRRDPAGLAAGLTRGSAVRADALDFLSAARQEVVDAQSAPARPRPACLHTMLSTAFSGMLASCMGRLRTGLHDRWQAARGALLELDLRRLNIAYLGSAGAGWAYVVAISVYAFDRGGALGVLHKTPANAGVF